MEKLFKFALREVFLSLCAFFDIIWGISSFSHEWNVVEIAIAIVVVQQGHVQIFSFFPINFFKFFLNLNFKSKYFEPYRNHKLFFYINMSSQNIYYKAVNNRLKSKCRMWCWWRQNIPSICVYKLKSSAAGNEMCANWVWIWWEIGKLIWHDSHHKVSVALGEHKLLI